jgi:hypothetical protein
MVRASYGRAMTQLTRSESRSREFWIGLMLVLVLAGAVAALLYFVIRTVAGWFVAAEGPVAEAAIGAAASVIVAAATVIVTKSMEARRELRKELRAMYRDTYELFTRTLFELMKVEKASPGAGPSDEGTNLMFEFGRSVMLNGSDKAVKQWSHWRRTYGQPGVQASTSAVGMMRAMVAIMMTMRRDFGHKNRGLSEEDLAAIFLNVDALEMVYSQRP